MKILSVRIRNFRGFKEFTFRPHGHVVLMGQPRAGRSDLIEGIRRVLNPDATRFPLSEPLDFCAGNTLERAEVEVVIGDLGVDLRQRFFDQLEVWNSEAGALVPELNEHDELPAQNDVVVRLCYRAEWSDEEKQAQHWVDFPKFSDPNSGQFERVRRRLHEALPFASITPSGRPLELSARSTFRKVVDAAEGEDFPGSLDAFEQGLLELSSKLAHGHQVAAAVDQVVEPIRPRLQLDAHAADLIRFAPEGGSLGAIIRSLGASVDLQDGAGALPLNRHGSTLRALFALSEALYAVGSVGGIILADDFGEDLDSNAARHFAANLRARSGQVWLSTRRAPAAEPFELEELVRLSWVEGERKAFQGKALATKPERLAKQHLFRQLLPEAASRAILISEGIDDRNGLTALGRKRYSDGAASLPAAYGLSMVEAGGITEIPKLSDLAHQFGFRTVALVDHDGEANEAQQRLAALLATCEVVIRLPIGFAIERALLHGLDDGTIVDAMRALDAAFNLNLAKDFVALTGAELHKQTAARIKSSGLHAYFVEALPVGVFPEVAARALDIAVIAAVTGGTGLVELEI